jgi:release factor glutamine methyltransferase
MLERRLQYEPIQYIIGKWDFHHLTGLIIKKPMLCPRPETEELVELVLADVRRLIKERALDNENNKRDKIRILDVGAGTGAIGIALAYQYPKHVQVVALDVLAEAVDLSTRNAEMFLSPLVANDKSEEQIDVRSLYHVIHCSAKDFTNSPTVAGCQDQEKQRQRMGFDIVVSNPPYIPSGDMDGLSIDVLQYESREALCGGNDGLDIVRDIIQRLPEWMSCSNLNEALSQTRHCWMEVDDSHPRLLEKWLAPGSEESKLYGVEYCECLKDFCGRDRFVRFRIL